MIKSHNPNYKAYVQLKIDRNKFIRTLGFSIDKIEEGYIEGTLDFQERYEQQNGYFHGGVISSLCDMVCGYATYSLVAEGDQVFTVELKVSYLRKGIGDKLKAIGRVIKAGNRFHFCEAEVYVINDGEEKLIAKASSTMAVISDKVHDKYGD